MIDQIKKKSNKGKKTMKFFLKMTLFSLGLTFVAVLAMRMTGYDTKFNKFFLFLGAGISLFVLSSGGLFKFFDGKINPVIPVKTVRSEREEQQNDNQDMVSCYTNLKDLDEENI